MKVREFGLEGDGIIQSCKVYLNKELLYKLTDLCGLVVRVPGYRSKGPGSIPSATRFSEKYWVLIGDHSAS
jgi:hypothetical protein